MLEEPLFHFQDQYRPFTQHRRRQSTIPCPYWITATLTTPPSSISFSVPTHSVHHYFNLDADSGVTIEENPLHTKLTKLTKDQEAISNPTTALFPPSLTLAGNTKSHQTPFVLFVRSPATHQDTLAPPSPLCLFHTSTPPALQGP